MNPLNQTEEKREAVPNGVSRVGIAALGVLLQVLWIVWAALKLTRYYAWVQLAISVLAFLLALRLVMRSRAASDFIVHKIVQPYHRAVGWLCGFVPFSVAELCWAVLVLFCIWYVGRTVWLLARGRGRRLAVLWRRALGGVLVALSVYTGFTLLWGLTYYAETFEEQAGVTARPVTVDELEATTRLFMEKLNAAAPLAPHAAPGVLSGDTQAIFDASGTLYDALEQQYPFLSVSAVSPKPMLFSRVLSALNFTGFFFPFTGEANLNVDSPECLLPATIAHELAHVRGVAPEQTANFVAILACDTSGDPLYAYSGYLLGYIHLSNALYGASYEKWLEIAQQVCQTANEDILANNAYWQQFESPVSKAADSAYSGFLQSYDQELGSKSYGAVVDLLVAYYGGM